METVGDLFLESGSTETQQQKQNRAVCTAFRLSTLASEEGGADGKSNSFSVWTKIAG